MKSEQVSVVTKCKHFVMTERSLRTHFASILGFGPFFRSLGAAEMAVDFQEFPVGDAQQADCGAGLDYIGDSSPDGIVPLLRRGFRNPRCFRVATGCGFLEEDETLVV